MSLHTVAQHMAAKGRGPDNMLVHMSSKEVAGLQALAKAHGGSLTVNPHTGLPEAGVLDKLMPMIVGAGLAYATGGASLAGELGLGAIGLGGLSNAAVIGGGMGLLDYAKTGDLKQGLMTGLGAYGGAGLGAGLAAANAPAELAPAAVPNAAPAGAMSSGSASTDAMLGGNGMTSTPAANLPDNIDMGGGFNPATGTAASPVHATPTASEFIKNNKALIAAGATPLLADLMTRTKETAPTTATSQGMIRPYKMSYNPQVPRNMLGAQYKPGQDTSERLWFDPQWTALPPYKAASGGILALASGGAIEKMSSANAIGSNTGYPMANIQQGAYATPYQSPISENVVTGAQDTAVDPYTGEQQTFSAAPTAQFAAGGVSTLGSYSDGGRLLKGPGDGVSDSIPAQIGGKQPARLADGEFVVPARIVSELGNGSTDAGARQLYKMMDRVQNARAKTTAKGKMAKNTNAAKYLPA